MSAKLRDGIDFFPLSVDYDECFCKVDKILDGFTRREGRPTERAILTSRVIDRPMCTLFLKALRNMVVLVNFVLWVEQNNSPKIIAMISSSTCDINFKHTV